MKRTAEVAFEYRAVRQDELTGMEGDILIITKESSDGWVHGSNNTGATGWFPMLYLDFLDDGYSGNSARATSTATNYTSIHSSGGSQHNGGRQSPSWQQQQHSTRSHHHQQQQPQPQPHQHQHQHHQHQARIDMFSTGGHRSGSGSISAGNAAAPPLPPARSTRSGSGSGARPGGARLADSSKIGSVSKVSSGASLTATQAVASGAQRINMPAPLRRAASSLSGLGVMFDGYGPLLDTGVLLHRTKEKGTGKLRHVFFFEQAVLVCKLKGTSYNIKEQERLTKDVKVEDLVWVGNKADEKQANEQAGFAFKRASDGVILQRFACTGARGIDDKLRYLAIVSRHLMSLGGSITMSRHF